MGCGPTEYSKGGTMEDGRLINPELTNPSINGSLNIDPTTLRQLALALEALLTPPAVNPTEVAAVFRNCSDNLPLTPDIQIPTCGDLSAVEGALGDRIDQVKTDLKDQLDQVKQSVDDQLKLAICEAIKDGCGGGNGGGGGGGSGDACCPSNWTNSDSLAAVNKLLNLIIARIISSDSDNCLDVSLNDGKLVAPCSSTGGGGTPPSLAAGGDVPLAADGTSLPLAVVGDRTGLLGKPAVYLEITAANGVTYKVPAYA